MDHDFKHEYEARRILESKLPYDIIITRNDNIYDRDLVLYKVNIKTHEKTPLCYIECEQAQKHYWLTGEWNEQYDPFHFYKHKVYYWDTIRRHFTGEMRGDDLPVIYLRTSYDLTGCKAMLVNKIYERAVCYSLNRFSDYRVDEVCQISLNDPHLKNGWNEVIALLNTIVNKENVLF